MRNREDLIRSIKKAMQGEMDSVTLYDNAAGHAEEAEVKEFFAQRREEERRHYNYLLDYYQQITGDLQPSAPEEALESVRDETSIFSRSFIERIGGDQYLFSAISTALLLEKDAFTHYRACAETAEDANLRKFFRLLEKWEMVHYDELLKIQQEAERYYWEDNSFEPF